MYVAERVSPHDQGFPRRPSGHRAIRGVRCADSAGRRCITWLRRGLRVEARRRRGRPLATDRLRRAQRLATSVTPSPTSGHSGSMCRPGSSPRQATRTRRRCVSSSPQRGVQPSMRTSAQPGSGTRGRRTGGRRRLETLRSTGARTEVGREESRAAHGRAARRDGRFGEFGGRFVPEPLVAACEELEDRLQEGLGGRRVPWRARRDPSQLRRAADAA